MKVRNNLKNVIFIFVFILSTLFTTIGNSFFHSFESLPIIIMNEAKMYKAIHLSLFKFGDLKEARTMLSDTFFQRCPFEKSMIEYLIDYSLYGKENCFKKIVTSNYSDEDKMFLELFTTYHSKNKDDFPLLFSQYSNKLTNHRPFHKLHTYVILNNYSIKYNTYSIVESENNDSLIRYYSSEARMEDKLFYELALIQYKLKNYSLNVESSEIENELYEIWKKNKMHFDAEVTPTTNLFSYISGSEDVLEWYSEEQNKLQINNPTLKIYNEIVNYTKDASTPNSIKSIQNKIDSLYTSTKEKKEKDKIAGMVISTEIKTRKSLLDLGKVSEVSKLKFDKNFIDKYFNYLDKNDCIDYVGEMLIEEKSKSELEKNNSYRNLTDKDAKLYFADKVLESIEKKMLSNLHKDLYGFSGFKLGRDDYLDFDQLLSTLDQNPLIDADNVFYNPSSYDFKNEEDYYEGLNKINNLHQKYPGAQSIQDLRLMYMINYKGLLNEENTKKEKLNFIEYGCLFMAQFPSIELNLINNYINILFTNSLKYSYRELLNAAEINSHISLIEKIITHYPNSESLKNLYQRYDTYNK